MFDIITEYLYSNGVLEYCTLTPVPIYDYSYSYTNFLRYSYSKVAYSTPQLATIALLMSELTIPHNPTR